MSSWNAAKAAPNIPASLLAAACTKDDLEHRNSEPIHFRPFPLAIQDTAQVMPKIIPLHKSHRSIIILLLEPHGMSDGKR